MPERRVPVGSRVGLHARPAAMVAKAASGQPAKVSIAKSGSAPVAADSVLNLMTLAAAYGDEVVFTADGEHAEAALDAIAEVVSTELDG